MLTSGIVDTRATKSGEFASSVQSVGDIREVEGDSSETGGEGRGSCKRGKQSRKRGSRGASERDCTHE